MIIEGGGGFLSENLSGSFESGLYAGVSKGLGEAGDERRKTIVRGLED